MFRIVSLLSAEYIRIYNTEQINIFFILKILI